tara:strand:- start:483 stop:701 length:219 start_codon:yes stop_codon:yes gene_type:complete
MRTILISLLGFLTALFFSYKKGTENQKQKQEQSNDKEKIRILEAKIETSKTIDRLSDDDVDSKLSDFFDRKK